MFFSIIYDSYNIKIIKIRIRKTYMSIQLCFKLDKNSKVEFLNLLNFQLYIFVIVLRG